MEFPFAFAVIVALLVLNAFFSAGELALMSLSEITIETGVRQGDRIARLQKRMRVRPQSFLTAILIGNNVVQIALATYAAALAQRHLAPLPQFSEQTALALSATVMTALVLVFGELMPKTIAAINTTGVARLLTLPLYLNNLILTPIVWAVERLVMPLIYLVTGGRRSNQSRLGREELATAMNLAHRGGALHSSDLAVAMEAIDFSRHTLTDVMTPRVDVVAVPQDETLQAAIDLMLDTGYSRLPVYGENIDEITGVALMKDLVHSLRRDGDRGRAVGALAREVAHFPATKSIVAALSDMRDDRLQLAVVIDEHGGTAGIATIEDILEELVGDISDESDVAGMGDIIEREDDAIVVSGRARLDQLPELDISLQEDFEATTIGGLVMELLGRPAVVGDTVAVGSAEITVIKALRNRIKLLRIKLGAAPPPPD